jgi:hypothetical protein
MMKGKMKWFAIPVVAVGMFIGFSAFTGETEAAGHTHASCQNGDTKHCFSRDCAPPDACGKQVQSCEESWIWTDNCQ